MSWHRFLWVYISWGSLNILNLLICVFCQIWEIFSLYFFKYYFSPVSFSSTSGTLKIQMLGLLLVSHRFLRFCFGLFIWLLASWLVCWFVWLSAFCFSHWVNSLLKLTDSILCYPHSTTEHIKQVFVSIHPSPHLSPPPVMIIFVCIATEIRYFKTWL